MVGLFTVCLFGLFTVNLSFFPDVGLLGIKLEIGGDFDIVTVGFFGFGILDMLPFESLLFTECLLESIDLFKDF